MQSPEFFLEYNEMASKLLDTESLLEKERMDSENKFSFHKYLVLAFHYNFRPRSEFLIMEIKYVLL